jgi:alkylhydroperoxidase family enzyme
VGRKQGITEQQLLDLPHFESSPAFSEVEKLVLRYAVAMTQTPVEVSDELFAELRTHFSPKQMVELTAAIAWENYRARFDHAFGMEAEGFSAGAVCAVPVGGPHKAEVGITADRR